MKINEFIEMAKPVVDKVEINEHAGSEGFKYVVIFNSGAKKFENDEFILENVRNENGMSLADLTFKFPHDCGFAETVLHEALPDADIKGLKLIY